jgi:hypothetical protein
VTGGCDEVEQNVHAVVPEAGISLDSGLFGENVIILSLEVPYDL